MDWQEVRSWFEPYFQVSSEPHVWAVQLVLLVLVTMLCNYALQHVLDFLSASRAKRQQPGIRRCFMPRACRCACWCG